MNRQNFSMRSVLLATALLMALVPGGSSAQQEVPPLPEHRVLAFNDLGMHCFDPDYSVFSLLPPFNVVHAQVVKTGLIPRILTSSKVGVTYSAVADPASLINTTSVGKTNFWDYVTPLFGASNLPPDVGLTGTKMPSDLYGPQPMAFQAGITDPVKMKPVRERWFTAAGIPLTDTADNLQHDPYPMMRIEAMNTRTKELTGSLDIVVPVSSEMNCASCHMSGMDAAPTNMDFHGVPGSAWSLVPDPVGYRQNILILHDAMNANMPGYQGISLINQARSGKPVLCASCHYSKALDLNGTGPNATQKIHETLSQALHKHHGTRPDPSSPIPIPEAGVSTCYFCHPGDETQCLRSVMAKSTSNIVCQNCHGGLLAVAGPAPLAATGKVRRPWVDMPKCQSCHTGDAVNNLKGKLLPDDGMWMPDGIRRSQAYMGTIEGTTANPILATNMRFAEMPDTLYRNSTAHFGLSCEACHGSTHAEWPAKTANDNRTAEQIQGHTGPIIECTACHSEALPPSLLGPHGLHNVNDTKWITSHGRFYTMKGAKTCQACHGTELNGSVLSKAASDREFKVCPPVNQISIPAGTQVGCYSCHATLTQRCNLQQ